MKSPDHPSRLRAVEFVEGDHVVSLLPLGERYRIDIALRGLALANPAPFGEALLFLHRLNAAAHGVHPWVISIDDDDMLLLGAVIRDVENHAIAARVTEGLAKAASLDAIWKSLREGRRPPASIEQDWAAPMNPLLLA